VVDLLNVFRGGWTHSNGWSHLQGKSGSPKCLFKVTNVCARNKLLTDAQRGGARVCQQYLYVDVDVADVWTLHHVMRGLRLRWSFDVIHSLTTSTTTTAATLTNKQRWTPADDYHTHAHNTQIASTSVQHTLFRSKLSFLRSKQNWLQFLFVLNVTALKRQISKFYPQIISTKTSQGLSHSYHSVAGKGYIPCLEFADKILIFADLWSPYVIGQTIYIFILFLLMDALCNRADHYISALWFLSSSSFFPRLISAAVDWMSTILPHMVWS